MNLKSQGESFERLDKNRLVSKSLKELQKYLTGLLQERQLQEGFLDYVHKCRIAKVKELIVSTDLSLKEISEKVGYNHYLTMSRAFKRYVGVTPKWYRQNEGMEQA